MSTVDAGNDVGDPTPLSMSVIDAIAAERGVDPVDLDTPLYEVVDLDALDALTTAAPTSTSVEITFQYGDHRVRVTGDGEVSVEPIDGE